MNRRAACHVIPGELRELGLQHPAHHLQLGAHGVVCLGGGRHRGNSASAWATERSARESPAEAARSWVAGAGMLSMGSRRDAASAAGVAFAGLNATERLATERLARESPAGAKEPPAGVATAASASLSWCGATRRPVRVLRPRRVHTHVRAQMSVSRPDPGCARTAARRQPTQSGNSATPPRGSRRARESGRASEPASRQASEPARRARTPVRAKQPPVVLAVARPSESPQGRSSRLANSWRRSQWRR